ncbi:UNVERIFIED_CONTAM: GIY-YIG catalytic domain-containing protein [Acetivibrio alkalicellulosi]
MARSNEGLAWLENQNKLFVQDRIKNASIQIRGIYGIFVKEKDKEEECVYVGRSASIYGRIFSQGHISNLMKKIIENKTSQRLLNAMDDENIEKIEVRILDEIKFKFDNYYKDMQRLASRENYFIDKYQEKNQCLEQVPEGTRMTIEGWESLKNKENN